MKFDKVCYTVFMKIIWRMRAMEAMQTAQAANRQNSMQTVDDAMNILFARLDEAIDDMEHGRTQSIEEAWKEIDKI